MNDRVLVLDLGGVVARWLPDRRLVALAELSGQPPEVVDRLVFESGFDDASDRGRFALDEFVHELAGLLELARPISDELRAQLEQAWALAYELSPRVLRLATQFAGRTAVFTNNGPLMEAVLQPGKPLAEVVGTFDELLCSWRLGAAKPELEAFGRAAAALGAQPEQLVFFDDSEANVEAARAAGWRAHRFTTVLDAQAVLASP